MDPYTSKAGEWFETNEFVLLQVIELLNDLCTSYDKITKLYDVHKMGMIGDAYMVASGVPKTNGKKHSNEIATMALDIMQMMEGYKIRWQTSERLLIRIGIHTGRKQRNPNSDHNLYVDLVIKEDPG